MIASKTKSLLCFTLFILSKTVVTSQTPLVTKITSPVALAEGPFWDDEYQVLYFVDIDGKALHRLNPVTLKEQVIKFEQKISFVIPVLHSKDQFVVALNRDLVLLTWNYNTDFYSRCVLVTVDGFSPGNRWNEAKADAFGRIWAGTKGPEDSQNNSPPNLGTLYRVDTTRRGRTFADPALRPVSISNGLVWSLDNRTLYYIDSPLRKVDSFDFDLNQGSIYNNRTVFKFQDFGIPGIPDGMHIDSDGNLWVTANGVGQVLKVNPKTGELLQTVVIPASHVTSVAWGGPHLDILYVTTMKSKNNETLNLLEPLAGAVFQVTGLGVTGTLSHKAVLNSDCSVLPSLAFINNNSIDKIRVSILYICLSSFITSVVSSFGCGM